MIMKTILFPVLQGVVARNLLRTDFFDLLFRRNDIRVIILVNSKEKKEYLEKEFGAGNIIYEVIGSFIEPSFQSIFTFLKYNLLRTERMDIRRKIYLHESRNFVVYYARLFFNRLFARPFFLQIARKMDMLLVNDKNFIYLFEKYRPDLLLSAHPFSDIEASLIRQANKRHILSIGIINSWDKMTSRSILRILPDKLIVHNEIVKREAILYTGMNEKDIMVVGVPHYDIFFRGKPRERVEFYARFNIDPEKRIILFCPTGQYYGKNDIEIINTLIKLQVSNLIGSDIQIFVRFPPNDNVDIKGISDLSKVIFYQPGIRFSSKRGIDWDMDFEDIQLLYDTLYWSALIICPPSSLSIDASIVDRPIINIKFGDTRTYSTDNINLYYDSDHYKNILRHGGVRLVLNESELILWIKRYLNDQSLDRDGRRLIAEEQCYKLDGQSSRRMSKVILNSLKL